MAADPIEVAEWIETTELQLEVRKHSALQRAELFQRAMELAAWAEREDIRARYEAELCGVRLELTNIKWATGKVCRGEVW